MRIITWEQNVIKNFKIKIFADRLIFTTKKEKKRKKKKEEGKPNLGIYSTSKYLVTLDKKFLLALANNLLPIVIDWCWMLSTLNIRSRGLHINYDGPLKPIKSQQRENYYEISSTAEKNIPH